MAGAAPAVGVMRDVPDAELVKCLVGLGMPVAAARGQISNPGMRFHALRVWVDVHDAGRGDHAAKSRIDYIREGNAALRRAELISG